MFHKFLPKEKTFFELFNLQCKVITKGLGLFLELLRNYDRQAELMPLIKKVEEEADEVEHRIFRHLDKTFVTPFDREDIQSLVHGMDNVMDLAEKVNARMSIYAVQTPPTGAIEMAMVLKSAFDLIAQAVSMLDNWRHKDAILKICVEVKTLENKCDVLLRKALQQLFQQETDALVVIKAKEIYECLEEGTDCCEDLANLLETILLKNA